MIVAYYLTWPTHTIHPALEDSSSVLLTALGFHRYSNDKVGPGVRDGEDCIVPTRCVPFPLRNNVVEYDGIVEMVKHHSRHWSSPIGPGLFVGPTVDTGCNELLHITLHPWPIVPPPQT